MPDGLSSLVHGPGGFQPSGTSRASVRKNKRLMLLTRLLSHESDMESVGEIDQLVSHNTLP